MHLLLIRMIGLSVVLEQPRVIGTLKVFLDAKLDLPARAFCG